MGIFDVDDYHKKLENEFYKLCSNPLNKKVKVGDKVVFAAGLVNRGHLWIREEAEVIDIGDKSVKIRYKKSYDKDNNEIWIHPALIVDVLESTIQTETEEG